MCQPTDITVLNIGSNSLKILKIVDGVATKRAIVTSLGDGGDRLSESAIRRTLDALKVATDEVVGELYAFATEAVRSALNKDEFLAQAQDILGVQIDVISGDDEAVYGYIGASSGREVLVIDVGGASTEISDGIGPQSKRISVPIGAQRLTTYHDDTVESLGRDTAIGLEVSPRDEVVCIGGTITSLVSAMLAQSTYDACAIHGSRVSTLGLKVVLDTLARLSTEERVERYPTLAGREKVIVLAGYYLVGLVEGLGYNSIEVSVLDTTEGYLFAKKPNVQKTFVFRQKNS